MNQQSEYGNQCDAITKNGTRCKNPNDWWIPCVAVYEPHIGGRADKFKPVQLCRCHATLADKLRKQNKRLRLHHGGWFGAFNGFQYGNLVTTQRQINWDTVKTLKVPKFWQL